ncbi:hypothetical protein GYH30_004645 [Glycine max]|nr:hypothetical protein GYH30_004645 [Glycine max]
MVYGDGLMVVEGERKKKVEEDDDDLSELHDSLTHSGEGGTRERSKVQSLVSLMRKRKTRRWKKVSGGGSSDSGSSSSLGNDEVAIVFDLSLLLCLMVLGKIEEASILAYFYFF